MKTLIIVSLSLLLLSSDGYAQSVESSQGLVAYRDLSGKLTRQSKINAKAMTRMARENGQITLWIMLKYPFNIYSDDMTAEEIAAQDNEVERGFSEVLDPLIAQQSVWHPGSGPFIRGPGCTVRATVAGLKKLIKDERILQLVSMDLE